MSDENNTNKKIQSATEQNTQQKNIYSKQYYIMFFTIMVTCFVVIYWLCTYTKLKETFLIIVCAALAIGIAEFITRKYLKM